MCVYLIIFITFKSLLFFKMPIATIIKSIMFIDDKNHYKHKYFRFLNNFISYAIDGREFEN